MDKDDSLYKVSKPPLLILFLSHQSESAENTPAIFIDKKEMER
jgi:hypothetical protein